MLEVDEDSRLGRELIAGGTKYHAHFVPDDDLTADLYVAACERLEAAGIKQYEISNFARAGFESRHNLKYWTRQPYLGFGVDAHSMLYATEAKALREAESVVGLKAHASTVVSAPVAWDETKLSLGTIDIDSTLATKTIAEVDSTLTTTVEGHGLSRAEKTHETGFSPRGVRFATSDALETYLTNSPLTATPITPQAALEEYFFLGLRLNRGINLQQIVHTASTDNLTATLTELIKDGLLERIENIVRLTPRGRLLSNEVFERFISMPV